MYYVPLIMVMDTNSPRILGIYGDLNKAVDDTIKDLGLDYCFNLYSEDNYKKGYIDDEFYSELLEEKEYHTEEEWNEIENQHNNYLDEKNSLGNIIESSKQQLLEKGELFINDTKCWINFIDTIQ